MSCHSQPFAGRNYRFVELRFLSSSEGAIFTFEISKRQTSNLAEWLLDKSISRFPAVSATKPRSRH